MESNDWFKCGLNILINVIKQQDTYSVWVNYLNLSPITTYEHEICRNFTKMS